MDRKYTIRRYVNHQLAYLEQPDGRGFIFGHDGEVVRETQRQPDGTHATVRGTYTSAELAAFAEDD